jgi:dehydrodolichyl diphosphate syntase complex subunit NUS1
MSQNGKLSPADISTDLIDAEISEITARPSQLTPPLGGFDLCHASNGVSIRDTQLPADTQGGHSNGKNLIRPVKPEPNLLLIFGPYVKLDGYPPWQIRLTEIFCTGDRGGSSFTGGQDAVEYQGFLSGLWRYARAQMRFGR